MKGTKAQKLLSTTVKTYDFAEVFQHSGQRLALTDASQILRAVSVAVGHRRGVPGVGEVQQSGGQFAQSVLGRQMQRCRQFQLAVTVCTTQLTAELCCLLPSTRIQHNLTLTTTITV